MPTLIPNPYCDHCLKDFVPGEKTIRVTHYWGRDTFICEDCQAEGENAEPDYDSENYFEKQERLANKGL